MATFSYKAATLDGKIVEGMLEAGDDRAVANKLQDMGYVPIKIITDEKKSGRNGNKVKPLLFQRRNISNRDLLIFTRELYTLVKAGLPLDRSLVALANLAEKDAFKEIIQGILKQIKGGKSLSEAMAEYPKVFPKLYTSMVKAGEAGGVLDPILARIMDFLERSEELKSYFINALIYPALLTLAGGVSITILMVFVVPKFASTFSDSGMPVPFALQLLMDISNIFTGYWWAFAGTLILIGVAAYRYLGTEEGRLKWDRRKLRLPLIGPLIQKMEVSRFARTLGTLLHSAVPLLQAMTIVKDVVGNKAIVSTMDKIKSGIKKGEGLAAPIKESGIFPPLATHLLEIGEESGKLDVMLLQIAEVYDGEARAFIKNLISLFEPLMIIVLGAVIGLVVVSMLSAIFSMLDVSL
ncbi:MAG: type II secretion system F family protein [Acidobacteria bacterium]|nr:type II secretion system F family protein [Acidobacteriota bacterium]MBI3658149.1 type II secretion system F family protein [Acidobacteriota bacterium]